MRKMKSDDAILNDAVKGVKFNDCNESLIYII